jgi:hypothetical protein
MFEKKRLTFFQTFYLSHFLFVLSDLKSYNTVMSVSAGVYKSSLNSKANKTHTRLIGKVTLSLGLLSPLSPFSVVSAK